MPQKKRKIDPKSIEVSYTFELGEQCEWSGELTYSIKDEAAMLLHGNPFSSISSISIFPKLIESTSKKIKDHFKTEIRIHFNENTIHANAIGFIEKSKDGVLFALGLPWKISNHVHLILISRRAKSLTLSGTDLFRNTGSIYGISISKDYQEYF